MDLIWLPLFILGLAAMAAEILVFSFGIFLVTGLILTGYALYMLGEIGTVFGHPVTENVFATLIGAGMFVLVVTIWFAVRAYSGRSKPVMEGTHVEVLEWANGKGSVRAPGGEIWNAAAAQDFQPGDQAIVTDIDNLTLTIAKE